MITSTEISVLEKCAKKEWLDKKQLRTLKGLTLQRYVKKQEEYKTKAGLYYADIKLTKKGKKELAKEEKTRSVFGMHQEHNLEISELIKYLS